MINPQMVDFQNGADTDPAWVETLLIPFIAREANIYCLVYVCVRPGLGVMANQVWICGALSDNRSDLLHYQDHQHLPAPAKLTDFTSGIGLRVKFTDAPRDFTVDYKADDGTAFHMDWKGLMDPFDIHDPNHSPQASKVEDMHADISVGQKHAAGHYDLTGHATGTLTLRGKTYTIDSIERMDHSWGPRNPTIIKNMFIVSATFGEDLFFHMICPWNPDLPKSNQFQLTHGYVVDKGQVFGLTDKVEMTVQQFGLMCAGLQMTVHDVRGKRYRMNASPNLGAPWMPYPSAITYNGLMNFFMGDREGYGVVLANYSLPWLNARKGRFLEELCPKIWV